ncbi:MAG: zinc ABC transporter substrate-binding protein [Anaerolineales bacterium]|nr:zinc ABC transporter substrate-binding protein [Anaerolineales bacterium]MCW5854705.1 zinc ABC transporter substrate-binding protein [Anaerolineales bacterium]
MPSRYQTAFALLLAGALLMSACAAPANPDAEGKINVVTTIGQIADAAAIVGGEHVHVTGLMGAGVDPHLYVASEGDVTILQEAEIIFYNGLYLEAQMNQILEQIREYKTVVALAESIPVGERLASPIYDDEYDPHVWFDVQLWQYVVGAVRDAYIDFDPENAADYQANAAAYLAELEALDAYVREQAARLPAEQRVLITAHDAFNYFGRAYQFRVLGLQGISTQSEASTADVQELTAFIVQNQVPAVFIESSVPVRNVEALQEAVAARGFEVSIGGQLFSDAMGSPGTPEGTYLGMVRHNIDTIVSALLGEK